MNNGVLLLPATPRCVNSVATSSPSDVDDHSDVHVEEAHDPLRLWLHEVSSRTSWSVHGAHNAHKVALETRSTNDKTILVKLQIPQSMGGAKDARTATMLVIANESSGSITKTLRVRREFRLRRENCIQEHQSPWPHQSATHIGPRTGSF